MDERELEGVIAHEMSHVRNRDVRLMTLVAVLVGVVALVSDFLLRISFFGGGRQERRQRRADRLRARPRGARCWRRSPPC